MAKAKKTKTQETKQERHSAVETKQEVKEVEVKETKPKRQPTHFAIFVKENYSKVKELPNNERLKKLSELYKETKNKTSQ